MQKGIAAAAWAVLFASAPFGLVLDGNLNSSVYLLQNVPIDSSALDSSTRFSYDQFHDLTLALADYDRRHSLAATGYIYKRDGAERDFSVQLPELSYRYRSSGGNLRLTAGRFNQPSGFAFYKIDGASFVLRPLETWRLEGALGSMVDSGLYFGGKDNAAGYAAVQKNFSLRNSFSMSFSRAFRDQQLTANDLGLHLQLNTEKKWHLRLGGKLTRKDGIRLAESYSRLTFTPKKLKYQFFLGSRSFFPKIYDPTDFYYFEYLFYNKLFAGSRCRLPFQSLFNAQVEVLETGGKRFGRVSAYWMHKYLDLRLEKGILDREDDYLIDAEVKYDVMARLRLQTGGSVVHYQTRMNSFPGASDLDNIFTSYFIAAESNFPRSLRVRLKLENRTNPERIYDLRLFLHLSYSFTSEPRERFPWEY